MIILYSLLIAETAIGICLFIKMEKRNKELRKKYLTQKKKGGSYNKIISELQRKIFWQNEELEVATNEFIRISDELSASKADIKKIKGENLALSLEIQRKQIKENNINREIFYE